MAQLDQNLCFKEENQNKTKTKKQKPTPKKRKEKKPLNCPPLLIQQNTPHTIIMFPYLPFCNPQNYSHLHLFFVSKQLCVLSCGLFGLSDYFKKILTKSNLSYKKLLTLPIHPFYYFFVCPSLLFLSFSLSKPSFSLPPYPYIFIYIFETIRYSSICIS